MIAYFVHDPRKSSDTIYLPDQGCFVPVDRPAMERFISVTPDFANWTGQACAFVDTRGVRDRGRHPRRPGRRLHPPAGPVAGADVCQSGKPHGTAPMNCPAKGCRAIHIKGKWTYRSDDPTDSEWGRT